MISLPQLQKLFLLGLAGGIGTVLRYGLGGWVQRSYVGEYPAGTIVVNVIGCFLAGLLWSVCESKNVLESSRLFLFVGFLGGFTTFSAFALETTSLINQSEWFRAAGNVLLQNGLGFVCCYAGLSLGRVV